MDAKTLQEAIKQYSDEQVCIDMVARLRWPDGKPQCPHCRVFDDHYYLKTQKRWACKNCRKQFSVKRGTIFEDSPIPLTKWMLAAWLLANCKNGVSSYEIHRAIGVTQKSAWFMLQRLRLAMRQQSLNKMGGSGSAVEGDETYIGGKSLNMHRSRRMKVSYGNKSVVIGLLDRNREEVRAAVIPEARKKHMDALVRKNVLYGSTVFTDNHAGYDELHYRYFHDVINHVESYVRGRVHTNGIENFWSLLKRGLHGTYVAVEPYHLERYVDEQVFRFNNRKTKKRAVTDADRFRLLLSQVAHKRITYAELTGKVGETIH